MPSRFDELQAIFLAWVDLPPEAREARLLELAARDPEMAVTLERYFRAEANVGTADELASVQSGALPPERIGRFRILRELGRGGMGVVYEAEQDVPRRRVAVKVVRRAESGPDRLALFRNEVQALAHVVHPGIPQVYEVFEDEDRAFAAMELVEGEGLLDAVASRFPTLEGRLALLLRIADAVAQAHRRGVVHRDLKPANILVPADGPPKVIDFGIARVGHLDGPRGSGTSAYSAPEQLAGEGVDARADVYALGAVAWVVLTGGPAVPTEGATYEEMLDAKRRAPARPRSVPPEIGAILCRAVAPVPADRYADAAALADDLRRYLEGRRVHAAGGGPGMATRAFVRRHAQALRHVAVLGVLLLISGAAWTLRAHLAREDAARTALAHVLELADRLGPDAPAVLSAFHQLIRSPDATGTVALSDAWEWRAAHATGADRTAALVAAYVNAPGETAATRALARLSRQMASDARWEAFAGLTAGLPAGEDDDLRARAALVAWDVASAAALLDAETAALLRPFASMEVAPAAHVGSFAADGLLVADGAHLSYVGPGGQRRQSWELPRGIQQTIVRGREAWVLHEGGLDLLGLDDGGVRHLLVSDAPLQGFAIVGDTPDVYVTVPYPDRQLLRVRDGALERVDPSFDAARIDPHGIVATDLDGDGREELIVGGDGWRDGEVRVLAPGPGNVRTRARYRFDAGAIGAGRDGNGKAWIAAVGERPEDTPDSHSGNFLIRLSERLGLLDVQPFPVHVNRILTPDLDDDGLPDLVVSNDLSGGLLGLSRQLPDGRLTPTVSIPGLHAVDATEGKLWVSDGRRGWIVGMPGGTSFPLREPPVVVPPAPVPDGVSADRRTRWARVEELAARGLRAEAGDALADLARATSGPDARRALVRAHALLVEAGSPHSAGLARELADLGGLTPDELDAVRVTLARAQDFEALARLEDGGPWIEALTTQDTRLALEGTLDPRWRILRPEAVRRRALGGGLDLRATSDRDVLVALPLVWDGRALRVDLDLDVVALDWNAGVQIVLKSGPEERTAGIWRVGGGPSANHRVIVVCAPGQKDVLGPVDTALSLQLSLSWIGGASPSFGCRADDHDAMVGERTAPQPGNARLEIRTLRDHAATDGLSHVRLRSLRIRGARIGDDTDGDEARAFADGDVEAVQRTRVGRDALLAAVASAAQGAPDPTLLAHLPDGDLGFLLRTDPDTWAGPIRGVHRERFAAVFAASWAAPLAYGEAGQALLLPAFAELPLDVPHARLVALERVRAQLDRPGREVDAERTLAALRQGPDPSEAWWLSAVLRAKAGDRAGARDALARFFATTSVPDLAADRVHDDADLADLAPPEPAPAARFAGSE